MSKVAELLSRSVELVKDAYKQSKARPENQEITEALMELRENLQVIREEVSALREQHAASQKRITELSGALELKAELVRSSGVYWKKGDPDPWCPNCWENHQRATHLNATSVLAGRLLTCGVCNYDVNADTLSPPKKWP